MSTRWIALGCAASALLYSPQAPLRAQTTSPRQPQPLTRKAQDAADRARTKVVVLKTSRPTSRGSGTGFLARPNLVLTAGHVVSDTTSVRAWVNGVSYSARLVEAHPDYDLALLRLTAPRLQLKPVSLALSSEDLQPAEDLVVLAGPSQDASADGDPRFRLPIPAQFRHRGPLTNPDGRRNTMLFMRAMVRKGDSGSPVLRVRDGSVVGVLSSRESPDPVGVSRNAYAVPIETVHEWIGAVLARERKVDGEFYLFR